METRGAGGIAQLVEHLHGMQGVRSSNLLTSTKQRPYFQKALRVFQYSELVSATVV